MSLRRFGVIALLGATFFSLASAQSTTLAAYTSYVPTQTWAPNAVCSAGSSYGGPAPYGGIYEDPFGTFFEMQCGYAFAGTTYYDDNNAQVFSGTTSQGIVTCFYACSARIGCMGFTYTFTSQSQGAVGAGRCFHFFNGTQGALSPNSGQITAAGTAQNIYGAAYIVQSSPGTLCPFYDEQYFTDAQGITYFVQCGYQAATTAGAGVPQSTTSVQNIQSCLSACDAAGSAVCNHAAYSYSATAEPNPYTAVGRVPNGLCTFLNGNPTPTGGGQAHYAMVRRTVAPPPTTTTTTVRTSFRTKLRK